MKAILRKDNCLAAIEERPASITEQKWKEMDNNGIANLHLALVDAVLSNIMEKDLELANKDFRDANSPRQKR